MGKPWSGSEITQSEKKAQFMTRDDSQQKDKKTYRPWDFCNIETVNKDIC